MTKTLVSFTGSRESPLQRLSRHAGLTIALALRDVKMRYQLSILGLYWAVLNPLLMAMVWNLVFSRIFRAQSIEGVPYVVFVFSGITFWNLFANSLTTAVNCLIGNASLLSKLYFPRVILPTAAVVARLVDLVFSLLVLGGLMLFYHVSPGPKLYWLPLLIVIELVFTLGLAYIVAALNVLYRDVGQILGVILMLWFYISPVLYTLEQVPGVMRDYLLYNPIGQLVYLQTSVILGGAAPDATVLGITALFSMSAFILGFLVFNRLESFFAEVM